MASVYSVSQINAYIGNMFRQDFLLERVSIKGEVSNCKYHTSGHIYFTLKDAGAAISCIMFAGSRKGLTFRLTDGQSVVVSGRVDVYEKAGSYQLYATAVKLDGLGSLYERYEALKAELLDEGMFDPMYKQPIPKYIHRLGVVTAPTGAAVRDICQIAKRRNLGIQILLYPAKVQGEGAAESVVQGIRALEKAGVDTMIVGRGGGSIEDLWAFNEEIVARAIFNCTVPVISAVGHETDTVISDYVADLRAPTPSAGAELAVADMKETLMALGEAKQRMTALMDGQIDELRQQMQMHTRALRLLSPRHQLDVRRQSLAEKEDKLRTLWQMKLTDRQRQLQVLGERLRGVSPYDKIRQGYAVVEDDTGRRIVGAAQLAAGAHIALHFADGQIEATVTKVEVKDRTGAEDE